MIDIPTIFLMMIGVMILAVVIGYAIGRFEEFLVWKDIADEIKSDWSMDLVDKGIQYRKFLDPNNDKLTEYNPYETPPTLFDRWTWNNAFMKSHSNGVRPRRK